MSSKNVLVKMRSLILVLLIVTILIGTVQIMARELDSIHLSVTVVRNNKVISNAQVYIFAVMPNGTCFITKISSGAGGIAGTTLSIKEVIKPIYDWNGKEKRSFKLHPGLYMTAIGKDGEYKYFGVSSIKLPLTLNGPLFVQTKLQLKDKLEIPKKLYSAQRNRKNINTRQQAPSWAWLVWTEEHEMRVTTLKVTTDAHSRASVGYKVKINEQVAFKCTYSVTRKINDEIIIKWSIGAEISWETANIGKSLIMEVNPNNVGYISFKAIVHYECWEYDEPADGDEYFREHRVYITYYWPETLDTIKGTDEITGSQEFLESASGQGWDQVATIIYLHSDISYSFAIPVGTFVKILLSWTRFPGALKVPIDVNLVLKHITAINADARIYAEQGYIVDVYHIEVWRTLNAYYRIPPWVLKLKTH